MSWIQDHILKELTLHATRRYSDMRPREVEGNLFMYHLDRLIGEKYVEKKDKDYRLTTKGRRQAGIISVDTGKVRVQPKIVVMIVAQNSQGQYLLFRWKRQPFMDKISFPYGKTHLGESVYDMAARELQMKTNLSGRLTYLGDAYVKTTVDGEILNHMLAHIFTAAELKGTAQSNVPTGECFWADPDSFDADELTPGLTQIRQLTESPSRTPFFDEIIVNQ